MYKIAVLLTCFNRREKTINCLSALYNNINDFVNDVKFDIYLVDDKSTDGTSQAIKDKFHDVIILEGTGHLYWNRGMNLAWKVSAEKDYDFYLWLNDDTILKKNAIKLVLNNSNVFHNEAIICGVCQSEKTGEITYGGYKKDAKEMIFPNGEPQRCICFNGNIVLVPRSVYKILGNLDPVFHHAIGDFDYGLRAYNHGIFSIISSEIIGFCERNELPKWCNPKYSLIERLKYSYTPLGAVTFQRFVFMKRHYGIYKAIVIFFSNHIRLIFPSIWIRK